MQDDLHTEEQQRRIITLATCPTEPCCIYYTDSISQSLFIICKDKRHANENLHGTDIQKQVEASQVVSRLTPIQGTDMRRSQYSRELRDQNG